MDGWGGRQVLPCADLRQQSAVGVEPVRAVGAPEGGTV